jgi:ribonuclease PH
MLSDGGLIETQATAEKDSYTRAELTQMLDIAEKGIRELLVAQQNTIAATT